MKNIINRTINQESKIELDRISSGLERNVDFGAKILDAALKKNGGEEDLPGILFLRNFIEHIDGVSVLIRSSAIEPCKTLLRTALENLFSLEYIFLDNTKTIERAKSFLVWNFVNNQKLYSKIDGVSEQYKQAASRFKRDKMMNVHQPMIFPDADKYKKIGEEILKSPNYSIIKVEYDKVNKKKGNPMWYSLFGGPMTMEQLADQVGYPALYDVLYRGWSTAVHGNDIVQGKLSGNSLGMAEIEQLRKPDNANSMALHAHNFCVLAYQLYIKNRLPEMQADYDQWRLETQPFTLSLRS